MREAVQYWKWYWEAVMPDGAVISQFKPTGEKVSWLDLPGKPQKIIMRQFTEELAEAVRGTSKLAAVPGNALPIFIENVGGAGLLAKRDERYITPMPTVQCIACKDVRPFDPNAKAKCGKCGATDKFFCADCQENKKQVLVVDIPPKTPEELPTQQLLCPDCKARGKTRGLKRISTFALISGKVEYETHSVVEIRPFLELRITDEKIVLRQLPR
jgi:uncharacterized protein YlaI